MIVISKMITYHVLALIHSITLGEHMAQCGLHDFTNKKRKTKKGNNAIKGWSVKAKWYVYEMIGKISQDEQSIICKKWEAMNRKLCAVARQVDDVVGDDEGDEAFKMDKAMLYAAE
jgi:hypothetical protein